MGIAVLVGLNVVVLGRPSMAGASTASGFAGLISYQADPGERNVVTMSFSSGVLTITEDPGVTISGQGDCVQQGPSQVACSAPIGITEIDAFLGDMDDTFTMLTAGPEGASIGVLGDEGADRIVGGPSAEVLTGGPGDDTLSGRGGNDVISGGGFFGAGPDADTIDGGDGNDVCRGDLGNDRVSGGAGDDTLEGGTAGPDGSDTVRGGPGRDRVDYSRRTAPLRVTLDDQPGDGEAGERDNVASDVEDVTGGAGEDVLVGSALDNELIGGPGDDVLSGGAGRDTLQGGAGDPGSDTLDGGEGDDSLSGGPGDDALSGGDGRDNLDGGGGADALSGGDGSDKLFGGAGIDSVDGGAGDDLVRGGAPALVGADGDDALKGGDGNDELIGDAGDDTLDGGLGADAISGGEGDDTVDYGTRFEPIVVTLDGLPNDGAPGEGDNVAIDVENVRGGRFDDSLSGDSRSNELDGSGGEDYADGGGGSDEVSGGDSGDVLRTRDGVPDRIACGEGVDFVVADPRDTAVGDCERVDDGRRRRPRLGRTATVRPVKGIAGMSPTGIHRFVPLRDRVNLPVASRVDSRRGQLEVVAAGRRGGPLQRATLSGAVVRILQKRARRPVTDIVLNGGDFRRCRGASRADEASASRRSFSRRIVRQLRTRAHGQFRTRGRFAAATARGTVWEMSDRCDGTLTRVRRGTVVVRDLRRKRRIELRAGQSYLARAR